MKNLKNKLISLLAAATMCIGMLPAMASASDAVITINPSEPDFITQTHPSYSKEYLAMQSTQPNIDAGSYVEYYVYAEDEGVYNIKWKGNKMAGNQWVSQITLSVNGTEIDNSLIRSVAVDTNFANQATAVQFQAGINIIRFTVNNIPTSQTMGTFYLHNLSVTPASASTIVDGKTLIIEAQNYIDGTHEQTEIANTNSNCYGGSFFHSAVRSVPVSYTYSLYAPEAGEYNLELFASDNVGWLGRFEVLINDTKIGDMSEGSAFHISNVASTVDTGNNTFFIRKYNKVAVDLEKGENIVIIRSYSAPSNNNYGFALDCMKFTPKNVGGSFFFEGEEGRASEVHPQAGLSGGKWHRIWENNKNTVTTFTAPAGTYELQLTIGAEIDKAQHLNGIYCGTAAISIDGGELIDLTGENCKVVRGIPGTGFCANTAVWKYVPGVEFAEGGTHSIKLVCTGAGETAPNNNFVGFDCLELFPTGLEIGEADLTVATNKLAVGATLETEANLYYENGYTYNKSLIESVAYTSSNTNVATVDENGVITGQNPGVANITVTYNGEYTATAKVSVYDESGIVPVSTSYNAEKSTVTMTFTRIAEGTGSADVFIGGYAQENGVDTSFTDGQLVEGVNPARGRVSSFTRTVSGDKVKAFVWNSLEGMKPICDEITVK